MTSKPARYSLGGDIGGSTMWFASVNTIEKLKCMLMLFGSEKAVLTLANPQAASDNSDYKPALRIKHNESGIFGLVHLLEDFLTSHVSTVLENQALSLSLSPCTQPGFQLLSIYFKRSFYPPNVMRWARTLERRQYGYLASCDLTDPTHIFLTFDRTPPWALFGCRRLKKKTEDYALTPGVPADTPERLKNASTQLGRSRNLYGMRIASFCYLFPCQPFYIMITDLLTAKQTLLYLAQALIFAPGNTISTDVDSISYTIHGTMAHFRIEFRWEALQTKSADDLARLANAVLAAGETTVTDAGTRPLQFAELANAASVCSNLTHCIYYGNCCYKHSQCTAEHDHGAMCGAVRKAAPLERLMAYVQSGDGQLVLLSLDMMKSVREGIFHSPLEVFSLPGAAKLSLYLFSGTLPVLNGVARVQRISKAIIDASAIDEAMLAVSVDRFVAVHARGPGRVLFELWRLETEQEPISDGPDVKSTFLELTDAANAAFSSLNCYEACRLWYKALSFVQSYEGTLPECQQLSISVLTRKRTAVDQIMRHFISTGIKSSTYSVDLIVNGSVRSLSFAFTSPEPVDSMVLFIRQAGFWLNRTGNSLVVLDPPRYQVVYFGMSRPPAPYVSAAEFALAKGSLKRTDTGCLNIHVAIVETMETRSSEVVFSEIYFHDEYDRVIGEWMRVLFDDPDLRFACSWLELKTKVMHDRFKVVITTDDRKINGRHSAELADGLRKAYRLPNFLERQAARNVEGAARHAELQKAEEVRKAFAERLERSLTREEAKFDAELGEGIEWLLEADRRSQLGQAQNWVEYRRLVKMITAQGRPGGSACLRFIGKEGADLFSERRQYQTGSAEAFAAMLDDFATLVQHHPHCSPKLLGIHAGA